MSETETTVNAAAESLDESAAEETTSEAESETNKSTKKASSRKAGGKKLSLVIVESPAKAETIGRFLGDDYVVDASYGHVRDLPGNAQERPAAIKGKPWAELGVNVDDGFEPVYIVPASKQQHVARLKKELNRADKLLVATDEDREGEAIGWHLVELLKPDVPVERIVFHEITKDAIEEAIRSPRQIDRDLVDAQESRRILDRLFGYSLSPVLWRKVQVGLSAGRVQSVAVRILVLRERERAVFHQAAYWDAEAEMRVARGVLPGTLRRLGADRLPAGRDFDSTTGELTTQGVRLLDEAAITSVINRVKTASPWTVTTVEASPATKRPSPPFITSTLQQEASRKLGFTARRTMQVAQSLYEGIDLGSEREGLITYMRTDSVTLSNQALSEAQTVINDLYGADFTEGPRGYKTKTRNAQEAHEAIRPTSLSRRPESLRRSLNNDQSRLYELIWQRTLASQMKNAQMERTVVEVEVPLEGEDHPAMFEARGSRVVFAGYLRAYQEGSDDPEAQSDGDERLLPAVEVGETVTPAAIEAKRHETQPPARYTEASLVRKLEEEGLGRPSTYASIMGTIVERKYVFKQGNALVPTFLGLAVTDLLEKHFGDLVDPHFTAEMEETLDAISRGETESTAHLSSFYDGSGEDPGLAKRIETQTPEIDFPHLPVGEDAEGRPIIVRIGRYGPYLQRGEGGPGNTASLPPDQAPADLEVEAAVGFLDAKQEGPRDLGHDPETGVEVLVQSGRFGPYVQFGPNPPTGTKKADMPKRASIARGMTMEDVTLEDALLWLSLPRTVGVHPESGDDIVAADGRFGPYIKCGSETRSLTDADDVYSVELERALQLLAEPKAKSFKRRASSKVLKDLGTTPDGKNVRILDGRYGPYATDGETNASLPREADVDQVTLEAALNLIGERAAAPKRSRGRKTAAKGAKKRTTKKTAKKRTRKAAKKSATKATD